MVTKNLQTDYGAPCDSQIATDVLTTNVARTTITANNTHWDAGDIGKSIIIEGCGFSAFYDHSPHLTTITNVTNAGKTITLGSAAIYDLPRDGTASEVFYWGHDDTSYFEMFHDEAAGIAGPHTLTVSGNVYVQASERQSRMFEGIPDLTVVGVGNPIFGHSYRLGNKGGITTALIHTANRGTTTIQMLSSELATKAAKFVEGYVDNTFSGIGVIFTTGNKLTITGINLQQGGEPLNAAYFEVVERVSFNEGTGEFVLAAPLKNTFLETWPDYPSFPDIGAARILACDDSFGMTHTYRNFKFYSPINLIYANGEEMIFENCEFLPTSFAVSPSASRRVVWDHCTVPQAIEIDKQVETMEIRGGYVHSLVHQSPMPEFLYISDGALIDSFNGTPKNVIASDSQITDISLGCWGYGCSESFTATNCEIHSINGIHTLHSEAYNPANAPNLAMSNGVLSYLNSIYVPLPHFVTGDPTASGSVVMWSGPSACQRLFTTTSLTKDTTYTYAGTDSGLNALPLNMELSGGTVLGITMHPCKQLTLIGCYGCDDVDDLTQEAAQGRPIFEYTKRNYDRSMGDVFMGSGIMHIWGKINFIKVNVTLAYTGSGALILHYPYFLNQLIVKSDYTSARWGFKVNLAIAGERVIRPTTLGGNSGAKSGDDLVTLPDPSYNWHCDVFTPAFANTTSGGVGPEFTIEIDTDQGISTVYSENRRSIEIHGGTYRNA